MPWDFALPDWEQRIRTGRSLIPDLPLDEAAASRAVKTFNLLRLPDVTGQPTFAEAAGDWFREIIAALFGSVIDGERMVREPFLLVPKKNSKTTNGAGLMMTALLLNERPRAEFLLIAPTKDIADLAFKQCVGMIDADDTAQREKDGRPGALKALLHVQEHVRKVTNRRSKAVLQIKAFDSSVLTGVKPVGVLLDEVHEIAKDSAAQRVMGQIRGGLIANPEAFLVMITTQSDEPPRGVFKAELEKARQIRDGTVTAENAGRMLPILFEFPKALMTSAARGEEPWRDPSIWHMVTPNDGRSITIKRLAADFETAKITGEEEVVRWVSQHLNVEVGLSLRSDRWPGADWWQHAVEPGLSLEKIIDRCDCVTVGIDGGGLDDLFGLAVVGRERQSREWMAWTHAWCHRSVLARRKSEASRLIDLEKAGDLTIVNRMEDDIAEIVDVIKRVDAAGILATIGMDPVGIGAIVDALTAEKLGNTDDYTRIVGVSQGYKLMGASKTTERKLVDGTLRHCGQPLMSWCVSNARIESRGNATLVTKQASGTGKIDPLMALFDAVALMSMNPEPWSSCVMPQIIIL